MNELGDYRFWAILKLNWRRNLTLLFILIFVILFQFSFINALGWGFFAPDLLLCFPVFFALLEGPRKGLAWGFAMGLVWDIFVARYVGLNALGWAVGGWLAGVLCAKFYKEN